MSVVRNMEKIYLVVAVLQYSRQTWAEGLLISQALSRVRGHREQTHRVVKLESKFKLCFFRNVFEYCVLVLAYLAMFVWGPHVKLNYFNSLILM